MSAKTWVKSVVVGTSLTLGPLSVAATPSLRLDVEVASGVVRNPPLAHDHLDGYLQSGWRLAGASNLGFNDRVGVVVERLPGKCALLDVLNVDLKIRTVIGASDRAFVENAQRTGDLNTLTAAGYGVVARTSIGTIGDRSVWALCTP